MEKSTSLSCCKGGWSWLCAWDGGFGDGSLGCHFHWVWWMRGSI